MNQFLADSLAPLYRYITKKKYRSYINLLTKHGGAARFKSRKVNFDHYSFQVIDVPSFLDHYKSIIVDEIYAFKARNNQPVIYDCGANIGISVLYFKMLYPEAKIIAFEADPSIAKVLQENINVNKLSDVSLVAKAVWKDDHCISFGVEGADAGSIYFEGEKIHIPSVRLRDILEKESYIDFLKMDIEGAETEVLRDCKDVLHKADHLFIEYHTFNGMAQELDEVLKIFTDNGFRYFIQTVNYRKHPYLFKTGKGSMDLQLNIYGYKV